MPGGPALRFEGLVKSFAGPPPVQALQGIDLVVEPGEVFALLGPNGAGKTTAIGVATTRVRSTAGRVLVDGLDVALQPAAVKRRIGVVTQYNTLDRSCSVSENLYYHCRYFGLGAAVSRQRTAALLTRFQLADRGEAMVATLSGGLAQRVQIARAIAHQPGILFLDEPTAGLDPQSRLALWDLVTGLRHEGITVLLTTHYMEEADRLSDRVAVIDHGRVLVTGTPAELRRQVGAEAVVEVALERVDDSLLARVRAIPGVREARLTGRGLQVLAGSRDGILPRLVEQVLPFGLQDLAVHEPTLETVFIQLTGRALRE